MRVTCFFAFIGVLLVGELQCVPILANPVPSNTQLLSGVSNTLSSAPNPIKQNVNGLTGPATVAPGLVQHIASDLGNTLGGVIRRRDSPLGNLPNLSKGLPALGSPIQSTETSPLRTVSSLPVANNPLPSIPLVGSTPNLAGVAPGGLHSAPQTLTSLPGLKSVSGLTGGLL